mmetsp:Transcript_39719/g.39314  ORF Transcript_39719/g.39314 Transcript_39719/m.39314 type:complete len:89 (+) Transcript_39719:220-486(+)
MNSVSYQSKPEDVIKLKIPNISSTGNLKIPSRRPDDQCSTPQACFWSKGIQIPSKKLKFSKEKDTSKRSTVTSKLLKTFHEEDLLEEK